MLVTGRVDFGFCAFWVQPKQQGPLVKNYETAPLGADRLRLALDQSGGQAMHRCHTKILATFS